MIMQIDVFSSAGAKTTSLDLPASLFGAEVNWGLMHQAVVMQQSNARQGSTAHVKTRGEVQGSTKKLFAQKHTGKARRGPVRAPTLRGGGKAFGPRNDKNYEKDMPKKMRHAALRSALSMQAGKKAILGIESFPDDVKTKTVSSLLKKMPVEAGRRILLVTPSAHNALYLSARNIAGVKTVAAAYLNIEDVLNARNVIFLTEAIAKAEELFGAKKGGMDAKLSKRFRGDAPEGKEKKEPKKPSSAKISKGKSAKKTASKKPSSKKSST